MIEQSDNFEKSGLKIDKERVLTYSKLSCPFDCKYCFVEDLNSEQEKSVSYLSNTQLELLEKLPKEVSLIMLGCDTEFFQSPKESLVILERLSELGKDISVITKMGLAPSFIEELKIVDNKLRKHNNLLSFSTSLTCTESAKIWEPNLTTPERRIETLKNVYENGILTLVALRPLLPTISDKELKATVEASKDYCYGYYSGPLYLKELKEELVPNNLLNDLKIEQLQPHWMPQGNMFYKIEKSGQMDSLESILSGYNKPFFEGAAEANDYFKNKNYEKH
jgi:DNA repair photolyase